MNLRPLWITALSVLVGAAAVLAVVHAAPRLLPGPALLEPGLAPPAASQGTALIAVVPPPAPVAVGAIFAVTITASAIDSPLSAFQFDLAYNPAVLDFRFAADGSFLGATGRQVVCPEPAAVAGSLRLACASTGATGGATGDGVLAVLTFEGMTDGVSDLTLSGVQLADTGRPPALLPASLQHGQVIVGDPPGPTATPTPGPTATPTPPPTATPTPTPMPGVDWRLYLPLIVR